MYDQKPWLKFYGDVPASIDYPKVTLYEALINTVEKHPDAVAYEFLGYTSSYRELGREVDRCADALAHLGLSKDDRITIATPTCPQGIICFYAANKLGAVAGMIHPLSTPAEIEFYLNLSQSAFALTLDAFYSKFSEVKDKTGLKTLILARIPDYLSWIKKIGFKLTKGRRIPPVPDDPMVAWWQDLMQKDFPATEKADMNTEDLAVILYSGGTTGTPKGIMLSNKNFISEGMQVAHWGKLTKEESILAILPIFHGFGLGVCVNAAFMGGGKSILVPQFTPEDVAKLIKRRKPSFLVGVPTIYEALNRSAVFQKTDLSCLKGAFCGADQLPRTVKEKFEAIVKRQGGDIQLREGYGLTEAVTAIMAMPLTEYRENSVGIPFPDMLVRIVKPGTTDTVPVGEDGEICLHGPAVMLGYLDQPEETADTLKQHPDNKIWLHTGDIGCMDEDGFVYFKLRMKRMIKSSGINVYPAQVEDVLCRHQDVQDVCVIGVPDKLQIERVKGFVVLKELSAAGPDKEAELIQHCRKHLIKWCCPREIEFRKRLPKTLIGKVAFNELVQEEIAKLKAEGRYTGD
jgi:long-chain acyl-CoA synthetase